MMNKQLMRLLVEPIARRIGTALAVYLASKGLPQDQLDQLLTGVGMVVAVGFDIAFAALARKKAENDGMRKAVDMLNSDKPEIAFDWRS